MDISTIFYTFLFVSTEMMFKFARQTYLNEIVLQRIFKFLNFKHLNHIIYGNNWKSC